MARSSSRPVQTFTIGYTDMPMYDERVYASAVADMYATDHHEILLTSQDVISVVPEVLDSLDEPFGDSSAVPTYVVARETRKHVKVALSGDGGDELFAGYRMYRGEDLYQTYARIPAIIRKTLIEPFIAALPASRDATIPELVRRMKKFIKGAKGNNLAERFLLWNELFPAEQRRCLLLDNPSLNHNTGLLSHGEQANGHAAGSTKYSNSLGDRTDGSGNYATALNIFSIALSSFHGDSLNGDALNRMLYADFTVSLPGDMLRKVDAMSMAHALEVRVPLLDHRVCELAFSMPGAWKLRNGQGKAILIDTFRDLLPPALHKRPKWGFEVPVSKWLKAEWRFLIDEYLSKEIIVKQGIFNYDIINELVKKLFSGRFDTSWQLWNLICFQAWYYRYMEKKPSS
jgi:asparagine synthase (glutamine-hydrolysing)